MKLLLSLLMMAAIPTYAAQPTFSTKVGVSIQNVLKTSNDRTDAIIILKSQADLSEADSLRSREEKLKFVYKSLRRTALKTQTHLSKFLKNKSIAHQKFLIMNMIAVENVNINDLNEIATYAEVQKIIANPRIQTPELPDEVSSFISKYMDKILFRGVEGGVTATNAPNIWNLTQGEGIIVAGQDTGVQWDHPALKNNYVGNNNGVIDHSFAWHDSIKTNISGTDNKCGRNLTVPCDDNAHGTHTVGTIVGDDGAANKIGMAPKAKWMACRNMDMGVGRPTTYIECFEFFLAPYKQSQTAFQGDPTKAPHVINNSWGCPESENCEGSEFIPVIEALTKAGIMVVVSAGNEGPGCSTIQDPPAHHSDLGLVVGAYDHRTGKIAGFSSRGPSALDGGIGPDVAAPGVSIRSSIPGSTYEGIFWSGTSMAGPHAVGMVALMWSANKSLIGDIDKTIALIKGSATPTVTTENCGNLPGTSIPNNTFGHGIINAEKAVKAAIAL